MSYDTLSNSLTQKRNILYNISTLLSFKLVTKSTLKINQTNWEKQPTIRNDSDRINQTDEEEATKARNQTTSNQAIKHSNQ